MTAKAILAALKLFCSKWRPPAAGEVAWHNADAENLAAFLNTETGKKLIESARQHEAAQNASACQKGQPWACGFAVGFRTAIAWIITLSRPVHAAPTKWTTRHAPGATITGASSGEDNGAESLADRLAP